MDKLAEQEGVTETNYELVAQGYQVVLYQSHESPSISSQSLMDVANSPPT